MFKALYSLLTRLVGNSAARVMVGGGFSIVTYLILTTMVTALLTALVSALGGLGADVLDIILLAGTGDGLSIIGAAVLTKIMWERGLFKMKYQIPGSLPS